MTENLFYIALSLGLLFYGAENLVRGAASVALKAGLSRLMVGLTVVAFGTSSPELVVSLKSAVSGQGDLSVGNVIGSNTFNIAVILGFTALITPVPVHRQVLRFDAPLAVATAALLIWLLGDQTLTRGEGTLLFTGLIAYILTNVVLARREPDAAPPLDDDAVPEEPDAWLLDLVRITAGIGILAFGSNLLVDHSVELARHFGVSEAIIGLTIVAVGTGMPELATSLVAARRQEVDIAVGNVLGSNMFNILCVLGLASIVEPLHAPDVRPSDYAAMMVVTLLLPPLLYTGRLLHWVEGGFLLAGYGVYLWWLWPG